MIDSNSGIKEGDKWQFANTINFPDNIPSFIYFRTIAAYPYPIETKKKRVFISIYSK